MPPTMMMEEDKNGFVDGEAGRVYVGNVMGVQRPRNRRQHRASARRIAASPAPHFCPSSGRNLILADAYADLTWRFPRGAQKTYPPFMTNSVSIFERAHFIHTNIELMYPG